MIFDWIVDKRAAVLVVKRADIQKFALQIACSNPNIQFKASNCWLDGFIGHYKLSLRRSTTLFKLVDNEVVKRTLQYKKFVDQTDLQKYDLNFAIAMDETALYYGNDQHK